MVKKTGLGKGLEALFNENQLTKEEEMKLKNGEEIVQNLKLIDIEPNRDQPRRTFNSESLEELATSIKRYGVIQPIIVTKMDNYYQIVAGERRWRAAKKAGLMEIPCLVRDSTERKNREIALIENIQREDLNPIEEAQSYQYLIDKGLTHKELSDTVGIGRSTLANNLRILNLDERVQNLAREGKISEGHCRQLLCYEDPDKQYKMALKIIETGDSVRDIERKVRNKKAVEKQKDKKYEAIYRDIEDTFQSFFGTKVKLDAKQKSGKIIIKYSSNEELERILELIRNDGNE